MNAPHPSQPLDAADLAIIETHPFASELEKRLVAEIRKYQGALRLRDSRIGELQNLVDDLEDQMEYYWRDE